MKKNICALLLCGLLLTGCAGSSTPESSASPAVPETMQVSAPEEIGENYVECMRAYFEALDNEDYDAYCKTVYPPYREAFEAYLKEKGSDPKTAFRKQAHRFDEDGYESWRLTELSLSLYPDPDPEDFFASYVEAGVFDEDFSAQCQKDAEELADIQFSLYALYEGDEEPVQVVRSSEMYLIKTAEGTYLFG